MSAFFGAVRLGPGEANPIDGAVVLPDHRGLEAPKSWAGPGALLVHRQYFVTPEDLHEAQPTAAWGGKGAVLFDGRLDDRAGLCARLGVDPLENLPDSALVARALEKWGADAASHLVGDFVVAAWQSADRRLLLFSDPSGSRPLYFHRSGSLVVFSTVLPALLSFPGVPHTLDEGTLADFLANNYRDTRHSFFRDIYRVLGGTTVVLSNGGGERVIKYWTPATDRQLILRSDGEYVEAAREVFDRAVADRLRCLKPVPVMGSGGLDSSCIMVSVLGQNNAATLPVVTLVPESGAPAFSRSSSYASERSPVEALQKAFPRLAPEFLEPDARPDIAYAPESIFEEVAVPMRNVVNLGWANCARRRMLKMGATAYLNGTRGNATLTWNGLATLGSMFRRGRWLRMGLEAAALSKYRPRPTAHKIWNLGVRPQFQSMLPGEPWQERSSLHPQAAADLDMPNRMRLSGHSDYFSFPDGRSMRIYMNTVNHALVGELYGWVRARDGLETRDPMADRRVIEFCMAIPEDQFLRKGETRWLARRLLRKAGVPALITECTARGEWTPEWFTHMERRRPMLPLEIARLRESPLASRLVDLDRLQRIIADWPDSAEAARPRRLDLDVLLTRALHVGAFIRWAETRSWGTGRSS